MNRIFRKRKDIDINEADRLSKECGFSRGFSELLLARGIDNKHDAEKYLEPKLEDITPLSCYPQISVAAERIRQAVENKERIVIFGDYDCDGLCATAILYLYLSKQTENVFYFIPDRSEDGYGLSQNALEFIAEEYFPDLIITVDCGITAVKEVEYAVNDLGIDIIVTDHHEPQSEIPDCIVVDAKLDKIGFYELCGAGIVLRLVEAMAGRQEMSEYLEIACLATIADSVPLIKDNRVICALGIKKLEKTAIKGIKMLIDSINLKGNLSAHDIAFRVAPRINALGRLSNANRVVALFYETDSFYLEQLINDINQCNKERQELCDAHVKDCLEMLEEEGICGHNLIVLRKDSWDAGILGIVCSRLTEMFGKPAMLFAKAGDCYKGSGRSVASVNIFEMLSRVKPLLNKFGGHAAACGLSVKEESFDEFKKSITEIFDKSFAADDFLPNIKYDVVADGAPELSFVSDIQKLQPFGVGNSGVNFLLSLNSARFSKISGTNHIKFKPGKDAELLWFNGAEKLPVLAADYKKYSSVKFDICEYQNNLYAQGIIWDVYPDFDDFTAKTSALEKQKYVAAYLKQLFKAEDGISAPKKIEADKIKELLKNSSGTLFIAYTFDKAAGFSDFLKESGLESRVVYFNVGSVKDCNPVNRLVMSAGTKCDFSLYENAVFLDKPLSVEFIDTMRLGRKVNIFDASDVFCNTVKFNVPDYQKLGIIYRKLNQILTEQTHRSFETVYEGLKGESYIESFIAFCVFYDLGIIRYKENRFTVDGSVKKQLSDSAFYKRLQGL